MENEITFMRGVRVGVAAVMVYDILLEKGFTNVTDIANIWTSKMNIVLADHGMSPMTRDESLLLIKALSDSHKYVKEHDKERK